MTIGVSTSSLFLIPRNAVLDLQSKVAKAETETTTGLLANPAEALGSQLGLDQALQAQLGALASIQSSNVIAQATLSASQNALNSISSDAQTFVNALITAQSSGDVTALQTQAQSLLSSLTSLLNGTTGGTYIFGGTNSTVKPVADYAQGPQAATAAAFQAAFAMTQSSSQVSTISAASMQSFLSSAFANLFTGPSWAANWSQASNTRTCALISPSETVTTAITANESAFRQLASAYTSIADLGLGNLNATTRQTVLTSALAQANTALQGISGLQTTLGISQSQITNANSQMQAQASLIEKWASQLGAVDPYEAASRLTNLTMQLETAYSLTNRISKLGLVNYLTA